MAGLTPKQESFAQAFVETGNASEAYRRAYNVKPDTKPKTMNEAGSRLLADCKIAARVADLKASHLERHNLTVDDISRMLQEDRTFARELEAPGAAISASMGLAKLYGHLTDKTEHSGKIIVEIRDV